MAATTRVKVSVHRLLLRIYRRLPVQARRRVVRTVAPSFTVGSICVVEREDGRVLLIQHSYRKRWGIPGGLLNRGEAGTAAAVREVREEVGLAIELIGEPVVVVDPEPRRVDLIFRARPAPGADPDAARPSSPEIVRAEWHLVTELPDLQHETAMAFEALARAGLHPLSPPRSG